MNKFLTIKNSAKINQPSMQTYKVSLNYRLISYVYDNKDQEVLKERLKFLIPLTAKEITLIDNHAKDDISDPIIDVIKRGALPEQFENNTFLKYQNHFPKPENESIIKIKELEEIAKSKEKKSRKKRK
jgi:hypothetical protein